MFFILQYKISTQSLIRIHKTWFVCYLNFQKTKLWYQTSVFDVRCADSYCFLVCFRCFNCGQWLSLSQKRQKQHKKTKCKWIGRACKPLAVFPRRWRAWTCFSAMCHTDCRQYSVCENMCVHFNTKWADCVKYCLFFIRQVYKDIQTQSPTCSHWFIQVV